MVTILPHLRMWWWHPSSPCRVVIWYNIICYNMVQCNVILHDIKLYHTILHYIITFPSPNRIPSRYRWWLSTLPLRGWWWPFLLPSVGGGAIPHSLRGWHYLTVPYDKIPYDVILWWWHHLLLKGWCDGCVLFPSQELATYPFHEGWIATTTPMVDHHPLMRREGNHYL